MRSWFAALATAAILAWATALPICDAIFGCGCGWFFADGVQHCDIQVPGPPDCPVCTNMLVGAVFALGLFAAWTAAVRASQRLLPR
jgi:hypothetical protein